MLDLVQAIAYSLGMQTTPRPMTGKLTDGQLLMVRMHYPLHAIEHLVQGWDAVEAIARGEKVAENTVFCETRIRGAKGAKVKPRQEKPRAAEVAQLEAALGALVAA